VRIYLVLLTKKKKTFISSQLALCRIVLKRCKLYTFSVEILTYAANPVTVNTEQCPLCQMPLLGWLVGC
jgi:hypothetical protein